MKKSFLNKSEPLIMEMIQVKTPAQAKIRIQNAIADGATAIGFQMHCLETQYRDEETIKDIFSVCSGTPIYFTNYRQVFNQGMSDEELAEGLLFGLSCGATLVDVMGDAFFPSPDELATDKTAIEKQMRLIDEIHARGGEVLMSSHMVGFRPAERVLEIALEQERRGADIVKIVTGANTELEEIENLKTCTLLKKELKVPFLFLSGGTNSKLHRLIGPALGVNMWLCFREYDEFTYPGPPLLSNVLKIKSGLNL